MNLDRKLYAWLAEEDERRFERAFAGYYAESFPALVRFLKRRTTRDEADLCDVAQEALLKFFQRIGRDRREAFARLRDAVANIVPLPLGALHEKTVRSWCKDVNTFRLETAAPHLTVDLESAESKIHLNDLADRIPPLQRRGCVLINDAEARALPSISVTNAVSVDATVDTADLLRAQLAHVEALLEYISDQMVIESAPIRDALDHYPGVLAFVSDSSTVVSLLPKLRVPTSSYLYEIAGSLLFDTFKRESAQKRGGAARLSTSPVSKNEVIDEAATTLEGLYSWEPQDVPAANAFEQDSWTQSAGFDVKIEHADLLERFIEYLHAPVARAAATFKSAASRGKATTERRQLESLTRKFERLMGVLSLLGQDFTQEEIAQRLSISRNQVKFVIETVQVTYKHFAAGADPQSKLSPSEDTSHV